MALSKGLKTTKKKQKKKTIETGSFYPSMYTIQLNDKIRF